ncbi:MAG: hypothetical protein JNK79_12030 [Chitinophagaceae bacterium]|nr:hypothetical protein [Chitinophagaceae bacterium]
MQFIIKNTLYLLIFLLPLGAISQSTYLPQGSKHAQFLERLEIKLGHNPNLNVNVAKPFSRRLVVNEAEVADSAGQIPLSEADHYDLQSLLMNNSEWVTGDKSSFASRKSLWNTIYKTKANFFEVDEKDFFLAINPVLQLQQSYEKDNDERIFLNSRGVTIRGLIAKRVGFYTSVVENLERAPDFVQFRVDSQRAVPGAGRYNIYKNTGWDYSDARGGITFNAAKYFDFQFAYDKNFIGSGYRSLFLSDFGNNYLFLKINTRIWKLNYQNIFMEINPQFPSGVRSNDELLDKKYAAIHHLSVNATKWLNLGLFEAVIFNRENHFDFTYLNPIIFLRTAEKQNNSPDNGFVGFDFKANIKKRAQVYGQLLFDELIIKELRSGKGWWGNKFGVQLGAKVIDVFGIQNLDIQAEANLVRPFTYSHQDTADNYTHYNQPLAHPLGANFVEGIGIIRYQPIPKLNITAKLILWKQGVDTGQRNFGGDIFKSYATRDGDYGYDLPSGPLSTGVNAQLHASYELKQNLFIDASMFMRRWKVNGDVYPKINTNVATLVLRVNMFRREYDY